jgi:hypothetical protein
MPYLALVHLRERRCATCGDLLAAAGARSFIVDLLGEPLNFADNVPEEMIAEITCANGHDTTLYIPNDIGAEETLLTPEDAPIAKDATVIPTVASIEPTE